MSAVFFSASALCLIYFAVIAVYSGIGTDFCWIWTVFALVFFLMGLFSRRSRSERGGMPGRFPVFIYTSFALWLLCSAGILAAVMQEAAEPDTTVCDYVIVLGDRVYSDGISATLQYRLDKACSYLQDHPDTVLVLSGGEDQGDELPEALAMYNYLSLRGIPESRMLIEVESVNTAQKIANSLLIISRDRLQRMVPPPVMTGVITSDYHMYRAMSIAEELSEDRIYPLTAPSDRILFVHSCVRECFAVIRDYLVGDL